MAENTIEVVLRSVDAMSADLKKVEAQLASLDRTSQATARGTDRIATSSVAVRRSLAPLTSSVSQVTTAVARLHPETAVLIGSVDNLAFAAIRAADRVQGFTASLGAALSAVFNPYTIALVIITAGISQITNQYAEATQQLKNFNDFMDQQTAILELLNAEIQGVTKAEIARLAVNKEFEKFLKEAKSPAEKTLIERMRDLKKEMVSQKIAVDESRATQKQAETAVQSLTQKIESQVAQLQTLRNELGLGKISALEMAASVEVERVLMENWGNVTAAQIERLEKLQDSLRGSAIELERFRAVTQAVAEAEKREEQDRQEERVSRPQILTDVRRVEADQAEITAEKEITIAQARIDLITHEISLLEKRNAPLDIILEKSKELDAIERSILDSKIKTKQAEIALLEAMQNTTPVAQAQLDLAKAQLEALRIQGDIVGGAAEKTIAKAKQDAEQLAESILSGIEAGVRSGKEGVLNIFASLGRDIAKRFLAELLMMTKIPGLGGAGGTTGGILGLFGGGFGGLGGIFNWFSGLFGGGGDSLFNAIEGGASFLPLLGFKRGGMVIPRNAMRAFQGGGEVPIMAHEGEYVMRRGAARGIGAGNLDEMNRTGRLPSMGGDNRPISQTIFLVDQRRPSLGAGDVELIIADSIERGRIAGRAVVNTIKRSRAG